MRCDRTIRLGMWLFAITATASAVTTARAQIVINELVEDEQDFETTDIPDTREFVELYNAGLTTVDISGWLLNTFNLEGNALLTSDPLPLGASIAPGGYYVIGAAGVPNVNFTPGPGELWSNLKTSFELRNPGGTLIDAVAVETFRGNELLNATQELLDQIAVGQVVSAAATGGWWGQLESNNADADPTLPNLPLSLGRFLNGRDTNMNGRDFGLIPATPGMSNNAAVVPVHLIPDVNATAVGTVLPGTYNASFKLPRVIAPGAASAFNPNPIPVSPQGGNAIIAWDETGGGNAVYSDNYANRFELYAYIDPTPFNVTTANSNQSEVSIYGLGSTDPLFPIPNPAGLLTGQPGTGGNLTSTINGSTGLGWMIQRRTSNTAGVQSSAAVLQLIDMNDGGDSVMADNDWQVKATITLTGMSAAWHTLSIDYNPATGDVIGTYDDQTFEFETQTGLIGNFYIGYREGLPGASGTGTARPPTYDLFVSENDADFDQDGDVDGADFLTWQRGLGGPGDQADGDANGDNQVTSADLAIWRSRFGMLAVPAAGVVPEPSGCVLVLVGLGITGIIRKRFA